MSKKDPIHKDMLVGQVVEQFPDAAEIITSYGLHCIGCHFNAFETLEQGLLGHGYSEEDLKNLIKDLNAFVKKKLQKQKPISNAAKNIKITVSDKALEKIQEIAKSKENAGKLLRVEVKNIAQAFKYEMNFIDEKDILPEEKIFSFGKNKITVDMRDYKKLKNLHIDYIDEGNRAGFKMKNPNKPS